MYVYLCKCMKLPIGIRRRPMISKAVGNLPVVGTGN